MQERATRIVYAAGLLLVGITGASSLSGQSLTTYGTPGLIEMPTAEVMNDGELAVTASAFGPNFPVSYTHLTLPTICSV